MLLYYFYIYVYYIYSRKVCFLILFYHFILFAGGHKKKKVLKASEIYSSSSSDDGGKSCFYEITFLYLYTSISGLGQKLVLTLQNNEFVLRILNSTPVRLKIRKTFSAKNHKSKFSAYLSGFRALL